jgi:hypothetical protein
LGWAWNCVLADLSTRPHLSLHSYGLHIESTYNSYPLKGKVPVFLLVCTFDTLWHKPFSVSPYGAFPLSPIYMPALGKFAEIA